MQAGVSVSCAEPQAVTGAIRHWMGRPMRSGGRLTSFRDPPGLPGFSSRWASQEKNRMKVAPFEGKAPLLASAPQSFP